MRRKLFTCVHGGTSFTAKNTQTESEDPLGASGIFTFIFVVIMPGIKPFASKITVIHVYIVILHNLVEKRASTIVVFYSKKCYSRIIRNGGENYP